MDSNLGGKKNSQFSSTEFQSAEDEMKSVVIEHIEESIKQEKGEFDESREEKE